MKNPLQKYASAWGEFAVATDGGDYYEVVQVDALVLAAQVGRDEAIDEIRDALGSTTLTALEKLTPGSVEWVEMSGVVTKLHAALDALGAE